MEAQLGLFSAYCLCDCKNCELGAHEFCTEEPDICTHIRCSAEDCYFRNKKFPTIVESSTNPVGAHTETVMPKAIGVSA